MAKVTFEFDNNKDRDDILFIVNKSKIYCALYELNDFYRKLYNGKLCTDDIITVKDNKVLTDADYKKFREAGDYPVSGTTEYIKTSYIENILDDALQDVISLLD